MPPPLVSMSEMLAHGTWITILHNAHPLLIEVKFSAATLSDYTL